MIVIVLFIVCGTSLTLAFPSIGSDNETINEHSKQMSEWPLSNNTFLLPKMLKVEDIINITIVIKDTPKLGIYLLEENTANLLNSTYVICTLLADTSERSISIIKENNDVILTEDIEHFFHDEDATIFNLWIRRRMSWDMNNDNILEINSKTFSEAYVFRKLDDFRLLQFTGDNVKVSELEFKFAVN